MIYVDGDACPVLIRDVIFRSALRRKIICTFVANKPVNFKHHSFVKTELVSQDFDAADAFIIEHATSGDLVVTQDILMAMELVKKGVSCLNPRGQEFTPSNIHEKVATRNLLQSLRGADPTISRQKGLEDLDVQKFASTYDRVLTRTHPFLRTENVE